LRCACLFTSLGIGPHTQYLAAQPTPPAYIRPILKLGHNSIRKNCFRAQEFLHGPIEPREASLLSPTLPMNIPRLESQQNSAETAMFCGEARNISNVDINRLAENGHIPRLSLQNTPF
jgi:hypothetical protein